MSSSDFGDDEFLNADQADEEQFGDDFDGSLHSYSDDGNDDDDDDDNDNDNAIDDDGSEHSALLLDDGEDQTDDDAGIPVSQHDDIATARARTRLMPVAADKVVLMGDSERELQMFEHRLVHLQPTTAILKGPCAVEGATRALAAVQACSSVSRLTLMGTALPSAILCQFLASQSRIESLAVLESAYGDELLFRLAGLLARQTTLTHLHFQLFTIGDIAMRVFVESSPRFNLRSLWLQNAHFRFGASGHLAPLVLLCGSLRELRVIAVNLFEFDVRSILHSVTLRTDFESLSLARKQVIDSETHEVVDLNRAEYLDFLGRTAGVYGASLTRLDLLGQAFTNVAQRKFVRRLRDNVSLLSLGSAYGSRWLATELVGVKRVLERNHRIIWRDVLPRLVGFALAISPLELSVFVLIHIFDYWFAGGHHIAWHLKWNVFANVQNARRRFGHSN
jgi:hypothetical protein